jgi:hypothetical protein
MTANNLRTIIIIIIITTIIILSFQRQQKQCYPQDWQLSKAHIDPKFACGYPNSLLLLFHCKIMQATNRSQNHKNENVCNT